MLLLVSGAALGMRTLAIKALRTVSMNLVPGPLSDLGVSPELSPPSEPKNSRVLSRNASHKVVNKEVRVLDCNQTYFRINYIVASSCRNVKPSYNCLIVIDEQEGTNIIRTYSEYDFFKYVYSTLTVFWILTNGHQFVKILIN